MTILINIENYLHIVILYVMLLNIIVFLGLNKIVVTR